MRIELSYEERIINALDRMKQGRDEHFLAYDQRRFKTVRGILQPLYDALREQESV